MNFTTSQLALAIQQRLMENIQRSRYGYFETHWQDHQPEVAPSDYFNQFVKLASKLRAGLIQSNKRFGDDAMMARIIPTFLRKLGEIESNSFYFTNQGVKVALEMTLAGE